MASSPELCAKSPLHRNWDAILKEIEERTSALSEQKKVAATAVERDVALFRDHLLASGTPEDIAPAVALYRNTLIAREVQQIDTTMFELEKLRNEILADKESLATFSLRGLTTFFKS